MGLCHALSSFPDLAAPFVSDPRPNNFTVGSFPSLALRASFKFVVGCGAQAWSSSPPCLAVVLLAEERNCDSRPCIQNQGASREQPHLNVEDGNPKFGSSQGQDHGSSSKPIRQGAAGTSEADERPVVLEEKDELWLKMRAEARQDAEREPVLASYLYSSILAHRSLERALAFHLGNKLCSTTLLSVQLYNLIVDTLMKEANIREAVRADMEAVRERDPACKSYAQCMLNFKGFLACQAYRIGHTVWMQGRHGLALALQSRISEVFMVDIHPAASIGKGVLFDHATSVVIGETAVVGDHVSILHKVTLGGTGLLGDRHPKIGDGVLIGAGATILGNISVGHGAKIGAGSVVLTHVPSGATAVGNPARLVKGQTTTPSFDLPSITMDHTSFINHWSDYVI